MGPNAEVDRRCPGGALVGDGAVEKGESMAGVIQGQRPGSNAGLGKDGSGSSGFGKFRIDGSYPVPIVGDSCYP